MLADVNYSGSEEEWKAIGIDYNNEPLASATVHYGTGAQTANFSDVAAGSYCYNAVQWAVANGITKGTDTTHFSPNAGCTRGQVVTPSSGAQQVSRQSAETSDLLTWRPARTATRL